MGQANWFVTIKAEGSKGGGALRVLNLVELTLKVYAAGSLGFWRSVASSLLFAAAPCDVCNPEFPQLRHQARPAPLDLEGL